jgi:hypothetical protein
MTSRHFGHSRKLNCGKTFPSLAESLAVNQLSAGGDVAIYIWHPSKIWLIISFG